LLVGYVLRVDFNEVAGMQAIDVQPELLAAGVSSGLVFDAPALVTTAPSPPTPLPRGGEGRSWCGALTIRAALRL
jgi:hypothetical protein